MKLSRMKKSLIQTVRRKVLDYAADGVGVWGKNLDFMTEPRFAAAWEKTREKNKDGWRLSKSGMPDVRWRVHVACWAAQHGLSLAGDFVECGVHTGLLSVAVAEFVDLAAQPKAFFLFDTFEGIPEEALKQSKAGGRTVNDRKYIDVFEIAQRNFASYPNARLIKGMLPDTLAAIAGKSIAYLSVDLNNVVGEKAVIERLWPQITPGAIIVIDDYGFAGFEDQHQMWDAFAKAHGKTVATLPTGQGILIR